ncbi:hypothetical protein DPX16_22894 [Anabarilius grahami]|uniref:ATP-dependent DNA helicase n=1 Tax=Anabarilius grahami TaxID=495550 RepID=A0A3N0XM45_ANAGA|nr:hypothetical protein DPX16_22894 [Anabarilius grahami]
MPHRFNAQLKPPRFPTYEQFYKCASVELPAHPGLLIPVRAVVQAHKEKFEKHSEEVDKALDQLQQQGPPENAWTTFAPEIEADRLECIAEREHMNPDDEDVQDDVPEYQILEHGDGVVPQVEAPQLSIVFIRKLFRSLNETQAAIFYTVCHWCQKRVWGQNPEQFFYFISGGAGCGKSHVIKCIYTEATKILRQLPRLREAGDLSVPTVLLSAFTGTAAFNISVLMNRDSEGEYANLVQELKLYHGRFRTYFRMSVGQFEELLQTVAPHLTRQTTNFREPIDPEQRLAVCLRANGNHGAEPDSSDGAEGSELVDIRGLRGNRASAEALRVRDTFRHYFNSPAGQVPWQVSHVNRGLPQ